MRWRGGLVADDREPMLRVGVLDGVLEAELLDAVDQNLDRGAECFDAHEVPELDVGGGVGVGEQGIGRGR